jgi:glycosyltransferase involved in cell wall biosynthesis
MRVHDWEPYLNKAGIRTRVLEGHPTNEPRRSFAVRQFAKLQRLNKLWSDTDSALEWADAVLIQEILPPARVLQKIRKRTKRLVFDLSDPIHLSSRAGMLGRIENRFLRQPRFARALELADTVVVENDRIGDAIRSRVNRLAVMRGPVDIHRFSPAKRRESTRTRVRVGWTGSPATFEFLKPLLPTLERVAVAQPNLEFALIGAPPDAKIGMIAAHMIKWDLETEPFDVAAMDIGISFVPETPWTRLRGGGKLVIYMAAGVPIITSPCSIGDQVVRDGQTGIIARTPAEWEKALRTLGSDTRAREAMSRAARQTAVDCYSYEAYLPLMLDILGVVPPAEKDLRAAT